MQVSRRLLDVAYKLDQARLGAEAPPPAPTETDVVPIEALTYDAPVEPEAEVVPIETLAPEPAAEISGSGASALETSFRTLERLQRERGTISPSLEALMGPGLPLPAPVPPAEAVAIESLCYRGRSALERAVAVRRELAAELEGTSDLATIRPLLQELLDLVPLALDES